MRWTYASQIADGFVLLSLSRWAHVMSGAVLDIGCGQRPYEPYVRHRVARWVGVDLPASAAGPPSADVFGSALALPFPNECFDVVVCTQVLEHVRDPLTLLREACRVLRAGGHLLVTAPQTNPLHEQPNDFYRYTRFGLEHLTIAAGANVVAIEPFGGAIALVGQLVAWHASPLNRIPVVGRFLHAAAVSVVQFSAWHLDRLARAVSDGGTESTIGYLLVARPNATAGTPSVAGA